MLGKAQKAVAKSEVTKGATAQFEKMGIIQTAKNVAVGMKHKVGEAVNQYSTSTGTTGTGTTGSSSSNPEGLEYENSA